MSGVFLTNRWQFSEHGVTAPSEHRCASSAGYQPSFHCDGAGFQGYSQARRGKGVGIGQVKMPQTLFLQLLLLNKYASFMEESIFRDPYSDVFSTSLCVILSRICCACHTLLGDNNCILRISAEKVMKE